MLKGNYNIAWDVSPHNENKRKTDMLNKYSTLSLDVLRSHVRPCPLIAQVIIFLEKKLFLKTID